MNIDYNQIEFILGNSKGVAVFSSEHLISCSNLSLSKLKDDIVKHGSHFIQISNEAWINTKFVVARLPQRMIKLKSGSILKVSRNSWKYFSDMPTKTHDDEFRLSTQN